MLNHHLTYKLQKEISANQGGEVFFGCLLDEAGQIKEIEPLCYGNDQAVLAPYEIVKKYNAILHNHPSGNIKPSSRDLDYASYLQNEGIGFFITDNNGNLLNPVVPPIISKKKNLIDLSLIRQYFEPGGIINNQKPDYEFREGQLKMSLSVTQAFNDNKIALIEAGTGIGKSLAYLIPAFLWAEKNKERVVISTNTINLQSQLINKDIPIVKKILNSSIVAVVVKGRRNYLCKFKISAMDEELEYDKEIEEQNQIKNWSNITASGDIDELNFVPSYTVWEKVSSDMDFCLASNCSYFRDCFFQQARRKAAESNILVVNHHILFADISIRSEGRGLDENILLPPYRKIIFDEAHNIIKSASSFFSMSFSKNGFYKFLSYIYKKNHKGFIPKLARRLRLEEDTSVNELKTFIADKVDVFFDYFLRNSDRLFEQIDLYLNNIINKKTANPDYKLNLQYRIRPEEWQNEEFKEICIRPLLSLEEKISEIVRLLDTMNLCFDTLPLHLKNKYDLEIKLLKSYQNKLNSIQENLISLLNADVEEYVTWLEITGDYDNPSFKLNATPLSIDYLLYQNVYQVFESIIFSSATLSVNKKFDFFKNTSGINLVSENTIITDLIESPYNYKNNVLFITPPDFPEPNAPDYNDRLNAFLKETIELTGGSSFVLFTSFHQLKKSYQEVNSYLHEKGLRCYYQGEMEKSKLLNQFIADINSNLFATSSFWEGVDAPGQTLRYVILAKLPFQMPTEPIEEARIENYTKKGLNAFMYYTLPTAVIKFRQGFGRLIRSHNDYGIVALLDSRVYNKTYGKIFFHSIPECHFFSGSMQEIKSVIKQHIAKFEK